MSTSCFHLLISHLKGFWLLARCARTAILCMLSGKVYRSRKPSPLWAARCRIALYVNPLAWSSFCSSSSVSKRTKHILEVRLAGVERQYRHVYLNRLTEEKKLRLAGAARRKLPTRRVATLLTLLPGNTPQAAPPLGSVRSPRLRRRRYSPHLLLRCSPLRQAFRG